MPVEDASVLRCSARFQDANGSDNVNVWYFSTEFLAPQTDAVVFNAVDIYLSDLYSQWTAVIDAEFDPLDLKVDVVVWDSVKWAVTQNVGFGAWGSTILSTATGDALPPGSAVLGKLFTGRGKHIGKKFFGGFVESITDADGNVTAAFAASLAGYLADMLVPYIITAGNKLTTMIADHTDGSTRFVTAVGVGDALAYQRRRRPGTGS